MKLSGCCTFVLGSSTQSTEIIATTLRPPPRTSFALRITERIQEDQDSPREASFLWFGNLEFHRRLLFSPSRYDTTGGSTTTTLLLTVILLRRCFWWSLMVDHHPAETQSAQTTQQQQQKPQQYYGILGNQNLCRGIVNAFVKIVLGWDRSWSMMQDARCDECDD